MGHFRHGDTQKNKRPKKCKCKPALDQCEKSVFCKNTIRGSIVLEVLEHFLHCLNSSMYAYIYCQGRLELELKSRSFERWFKVI